MLDAKRQLLARQCFTRLYGLKLQSTLPNSHDTFQLYGCKDSSTAEIKVAGLNGTKTASNAEIAIFGRYSSHGVGVRPVGDWDQAGTLAIKMFKPVKAFDIIRFSFQLKNPDKAQVCGV